MCSKSHFSLSSQAPGVEGCIAGSCSLCIFIAHAGLSSVGFLGRVPCSGVTKFNQGLMYVLVADAIPLCFIISLSATQGEVALPFA